MTPAPLPPNESRPARRDGLRFADTDEAIADICRLGRGCRRAGNWSLEQICWHLERTTRARMAAGPYPPNTPEQDARAATLAGVLATGRLPPNLVAPEPLVPPTDIDASAVDAFIQTLRELKTRPGPFAPHRLFGHMSDADTHKQILIHTAHHLSCLMPTAAVPRDTLKFATLADVIADVRRLQKSHASAGQWTLPQAAWHLNLALQSCLKPVPAGTVSTPGQAGMKSTMLDPMFAAGTMPRALPIFPGTDPIKDAGAPLDDGAVDQFIGGLRDLEAFPHDRVAFGPFGVISTEEFRRFIRIHSANHLSNFIPTT